MFVGGHHTEHLYYPGHSHGSWCEAACTCHRARHCVLYGRQQGGYMEGHVLYNIAYSTAVAKVEWISDFKPTMTSHMSMA